MINGVERLRDLLFGELATGVRSSGRLISSIREEEWNWRPAESMRTLKELVGHLAAIPEVDVTIGREAAEEEIRLLEKKYETLSNAQAYIEAMERGFEVLKSHYGSMPESEFLTRESRPFYMTHGEVQAKMLLETVTHLFHHRAQLFQYLKQLHHDVNMFDLYV